MEEALGELVAAVESVRSQEEEYLLLREKYCYVRNEREKATFSMLMRMDPAALTAIRKEFFIREDKVTLDEFIFIIENNINTHCNSEEEQRVFVSNMFELFKDIDVNGDGDMEWSEFTTFTVEKANILNKRLKFTNIANFHESSDTLDPSAMHRHRHDLSQMCAIRVLHQFAMIEENKNSIFFFSTSTGKLIKAVTTEAVPQAILHVESMGLLVSACADMTMTTHSLDDPNPNKRYRLRSTWASPGIQMALAFVKSKDVLYSGGANGNIYAWNIRERNLLSTIEAHNDIVMSLIVLPILNTLVSASLDTTISIWDVYTHERITHLRGHKKGVFQLDYNPECRLLFSCGFDHDVCVWSPFVNSMIYRLKGHHATLVGCQCIRNSFELITADAAGVFKLWDVRNFQCVQTFFANTTLVDQGFNCGDGNNSKLNCFFHISLPSSNRGQVEDDSRIFAASKRLYCFDQARVIHEATTDFSNVHWVSWNAESFVLVTASEKNIIIWDGLAGSKTIIHANICGHEISACCLDDRKRKIIIGDTTGGIGVYNRLNGALMKSTVKDIESIVVSLCYVDETRRFIAGFSNGVMRLYNENSLDDCGFIRSFDMTNKHPELMLMSFSPLDRTVVSIGTQGNLLKVWDYDTGKCDTESVVCGPSEIIISMCFLDPYPLLVTSDSVGNINIWGSRASRWPEAKLSGFLNLTPTHTKPEPRPRFKIEDNDDPYRKILPMTDDEYHADMLNMTPCHSHDMLDFSYAQSHHAPLSHDRRRASSSMGAMHAHDHKLLKRSHQNQSTSDLLQNDGSVADHAYISAVTREKDIAEKKWGIAAPSEAMSWDENTRCLYTGDEQGHLKKWDLSDLIEELDGSGILRGAVPVLKGGLKTKKRDQKSALLPVGSSTSSDFLLGKKNHMSYLGIQFVYSFAAHEDRIICCHFTSYGVLTSAADKLVKMWSLDGAPIGVLLQSVHMGVQSRSWDLKLDIKSVMDRDCQETDEIIQTLKSSASSGEDRPDVKLFDLSGLAPGAESAAFSQSVLRQRIDKSGKILGLNITVGGVGRGGAEEEAFYDKSVGDSLYSDYGAGESITSSVVSKTLVCALHELKSMHGSDNLASKKQLYTEIQQRRQEHKMSLVANKYESKSKIKLPTLTPGRQTSFAKAESDASVVDSLLGTSHVGSTGNRSDVGFTNAVVIHKHDTDSPMEMLATGSRTPQCQDTGIGFMASGGRPKQQPRALSARVEKFRSSCNRFSSFGKLDAAMKRDPKDLVSPRTLEKFRGARKDKFEILANQKIENKRPQTSHSSFPRK